VAANEQARLILESERAGLLINIIDAVEGAVAVSKVSVGRYDVSRHDGRVAPVVVTGLASSRAALAGFRDALLKSPLVAKVDLPISNFAQDRDIQFTLTITIASSTPSIPTS
jgi:hypothetical protein